MILKMCNNNEHIIIIKSVYLLGPVVFVYYIVLCVVIFLFIRFHFYIFCVCFKLFCVF